MSVKLIRNTCNKSVSCRTLIECSLCLTMVHFATLNDHKLYQTLSQSNNHYRGSSNNYSTNTCSTLKPPKNLSNLFNEFNNFSSQQNKNTENIIN